MNHKKILSYMLLGAVSLLDPSQSDLHAKKHHSSSSSSSDSSSSNPDWPSFGKNLANTRAQKAEKKLTPCNVKHLKEKLFLNGGSLAIAHPPAVVDDIIYWADADNVYAKDAFTGQEVWTRSAPGFFDSTPVISESKVFVTRTTGPGALVEALNKQTGALLWSTDIATTQDQGIFGNLALIEKENILIAVTTGANMPDQWGSVVALDSETGNILWNYQTTLIFNPPNMFPQAPNDGGGGVGIFGTPAVDTKLGYVFIGTGQNIVEPVTPISDALIALNYRTTDPSGSLVWAFQATDDDVGAPGDPEAKDWDLSGGPNLLRVKIDGKKRDIVIICDKKGSMYALDRKTGKLYWESVLTPPPPLGSANGGVNGFPATDGKNLYVMSTYSNDGRPINNFSGVSFSTGEYTTKTFLYSINGSDGTINWRQLFNGANTGAITYANGVVYSTINIGAPQSEELPIGGQFFAHNAKTGKELFQFTAPPTAFLGDNEALAGTTVYKGHVYVGFGFFDPSEVGIRVFSLDN